MSFRTNALKVQAFAGALYGMQVGTTTMAQVNADIASNAGLSNTLNSYYASSFGGVANATVAASVATNLGLTGDALTSGTAYVLAQLNAAPAAGRGAVISNILDLFAGLASDATFGVAATAWNAKVDAANAYTGASNVAIGSTVGQSQTFTLTADADNITGSVYNDTFNSSPAVMLVFGFTVPVDSFMGDILDGGDGDDTLNIVAAGFGEGIGFQSVNIENINITTRAPIGDSTVVKIDLQDVTGVEVLTAQNLRQALELTEVQEIAAIVYQGNTRGLDDSIDSNLTVTYAAEVVDGEEDELDLTVDSNTAGGLVTVNGIEIVNITAVGTNLFDLSAADAEVNISGAGNEELDLFANDAVTVNNEAAGDVILSATLATTVSNSGSGNLILTDVANAATVTNSGTGSLSFEVAAADTATITNSGLGDMTVVTVGASAAITNSGSGDLTVKATGATSTITNSGAGNTTIETSGATVIDSTGDGDLTVNEDAFATTAAITATGSGDLTVTVKNIDVTIDASESTGQVTLNVTTAGTRTSVDFTGSAGDDKVVLGAAALVAGDLIDGGDGTDTIEVSDAALSLATFTGVTNFETVKYAGTDAVAWTDLESLGTDVVLEFDSVGAAAAGGDTGNNGVTGTAVAPGGNGEDGGTGVDADNVALAIAADGVSNIDLTGTAATINVVLNNDLSAVGGTGGNGGVGGAGFVGTDAVAGTTAATAGTDGGTGGQGEMGGNGASVVTTDATTLTLTLNGVTLNSSGGNGGNGGAGAAGGAGGNGVGTTGYAIGGAGGNGGDGGAGGIGGLAAVTVDASSALTVTIHSNGTANTLIADGGEAGSGGSYGRGGAGGLAADIAGAVSGTNGINGNAGSAGIDGVGNAGLLVADGAAITIDGDGDLDLGLVSGDGLTIDASELTGSLTIETEDGDDSITGGTGSNALTLGGGADTIDILLSVDVADSIDMTVATGTTLTTAVEITGFEVDTDSLTVGSSATVVANSRVQLQAADQNATSFATGYSVYQYQVTDGVVSINKSNASPTVSTNSDATAAFFEDAVEIIFNDVFDNTGVSGTLSGAGEAAIWTDGTDSWVFVSDGIGGYTAGDDFVVKLIGVAADTTDGILA